jgi:hypothetical protein
MTVENDPEKAAFLREIADEIRTNETSNNEQIAAILHRVSDMYDDREETSPQDIYLNMKYILNIKEQGGIQR